MWNAWRENWVWITTPFVIALIVVALGMALSIAEGNARPPLTMQCH